MAQEQIQSTSSNKRLAQRIEFTDHGDSVSFKAQLIAWVRKEKAGLYESYCPALDLWSQGDTIAEAKKNIAEAAGLFIETSYEQGELNSVLRLLLDCGAEVKRQEKRQKSPPTVWGKYSRLIVIPVFLGTRRKVFRRARISRK